MRYTDFKAAIRDELTLHSSGQTWAELRERLALPYDRPCPTWTKSLEEEIGLCRVKSAGRALVWKLRGKSKT